MPRDKLFGERFKVRKWKWYLADLRDYHNPVLVRKHLDTKQQALYFREKYYDKSFKIINYKQARKYGLKDFVNKYRRHGHHTAKYNYPPGCSTKLQRQIHRNNTRQKMKTKMRNLKVTETIVWEILDDKPVLFVKRMKRYASNHWVYSEPTAGLHDFEKKYEWIKDIRHLSNIVR